MGKTLYLECSSGISGDMTAAALLDLGADRTALEKALSSLDVTGYKVKISRVNKAGLDVCDFDVQLDAQHENHDHDMGYLHGEEHAHHDHDHDKEHHHRHGFGPRHDHHHEHSHEYRGLPEILSILDRADLTLRARETAKRIFHILAEAESKAHGVPLEKVHFHEVGAVDSIVDITAVAVCLDNLDVTQVIIPSLSEGYGTVRCQHGVIPVPVPATVNIVSAYGLNLHFSNIEGELVTPTGAAIAAAIRTGDKLPARFHIEKTGMGAGKRSYERPSLLRAMLIEDTGRLSDGVWKLETNLDDCTGEALGYVMDRLLESGARDVHYTPVYMKKNRPGWQLTVLCDKAQREMLEEIIFTETTTIGIRRVWMERTVLPREMRTVKTPWGEAQVKVCTLGSGKRFYPEYESVAALCRASGRSYQEVYGAVMAAAGD